MRLCSHSLGFLPSDEVPLYSFTSKYVMFFHVFHIFHHGLTCFIELDLLDLWFWIGFSKAVLCGFNRLLGGCALIYRFTLKSFSPIRSLVFEIVFNWPRKGRY